MKALTVIVLTAFVTNLSSSPVPRRAAVCNPCGPLSQASSHHSEPTGRYNFAMTKSKVSNSLDDLYKLLNITTTQEETDITSTTYFNNNHNITGCGSPKVIGNINWIVCVYNAIAGALRNITQNEIHSLTLNTSDIITMTRNVLCNFKLVIIQTEDTHAKIGKQLSKDACPKSSLNRETTPSPLAAIEALRNAKYLVQSVNTTLAKNVSGRSMLYRNKRGRRGNKKRRKNKCKKTKKGKNRKRSCKRRNKNRRKNRRNKKKNERKNRKNRMKKNKHKLNKSKLRKMSHSH